MIFIIQRFKESDHLTQCILIIDRSMIEIFAVGILHDQGFFFRKIDIQGIVGVRRGTGNDPEGDSAKVYGPFFIDNLITRDDFDLAQIRIFDQDIVIAERNIQAIFFSLRRPADLYFS